MDIGLFGKLEEAILAKRQPMAKMLRPGLPGSRIRQMLDRTNLDEEKNIEALIALYSWKNGMFSKKAVEPFFPESIYQFLPLQAAVEHYRDLTKSAKAIARLSAPIKISQEVWHYFPVFWDGSTGYLGIDLRAGMQNRVVEIEFESDQPIREIYHSFDEFLVDTIRAIKVNEPMKHLQ